MEGKRVYLSTCTCVYGPWLTHLDSTGFILLSGDEAIINALTPGLTKMTGKLLFLWYRGG